jgi:hypothetical protein
MCGKAVIMNEKFVQHTNNINVHGILYETADLTIWDPLSRQDVADFSQAQFTKARFATAVKPSDGNGEVMLSLLGPDHPEASGLRRDDILPDQHIWAEHWQWQHGIKPFVASPYIDPGQAYATRCFQVSKPLCFLL